MHSSFFKVETIWFDISMIQKDLQQFYFVSHDNSFEIFKNMTFTIKMSNRNSHEMTADIKMSGGLIF